jgi:hypothetical protein
MLSQLRRLGLKIRHASLNNAAIVNIQVARRLPSFWFHVP